MGNHFEQDKIGISPDYEHNNTKKQDFSFVEKIYAQKTPYFLKDDNVQYDNAESQVPLLFIDALEKFKSNQVYKILKKDDDGHLKSYHHKNQKPFQNFADRVQDEKYSINHFLVQVVTQNVLFNEEVAQITYFKDITFSVIQDQI